MIRKPGTGRTGPNFAAFAKLVPKVCPLDNRTARELRRLGLARARERGPPRRTECLDLPVVTEAPTLDELAANIREAISLPLESEDLAELGFAEDPTILATMEL
jgi:hypothetical protein